MDPLSIGAGAVGFITIAIQSAKFLLDILSTIKDSPTSIRDFRRDLEQLNVILIRLSKSPSAEKDPATAILVQRCSEDVSLYARRLLKLEISPSERRTGKIWRRFIALMSDKELQEMRNTVDRHVSSLSLQLSFIQV